MTMANTNKVGRTITSLPRTPSHFLLGICSTMSNHRGKALPADFSVFGPSQQGHLSMVPYPFSATSELKPLPELSRLYPQKEPCTSRDTNKVRDLNTGDGCPRVLQIKITASEEVTAAETCSAHAWGATGSCLSAE